MSHTPLWTDNRQTDVQEKKDSPLMTITVYMNNNTLTVISSSWTSSFSSSTRSRFHISLFDFFYESSSHASTCYCLFCWIVSHLGVYTFKLITSDYGRRVYE